MNFLDYNNMNEFYTVQELAHLLGLNKDTLRFVSEKYHMDPQMNEHGQWGFDRWQCCQIHNRLYKEWKSKQSNNNPWA